MKHNPFLYGNPVSPAQFVGRRRELRRIVGRILNQGQSTALVGEPRLGKTSLLHYLISPETRTELYGRSGPLLFADLDAQALGAKFDPPAFWQRVLEPVREQAVKANESNLQEAYHLCEENRFGAFVLERLCTQMRSDSWRLVIALDEFNNFLHYPVLNTAEFFGGLRSVVSRSGGALALVVASRHPLAQLNNDTHEYSRSGSPYFNFFDEITLGPLADKDVAELLNLAGERFTSADRRFLLTVSGGHPYLLQLSAGALWEAYADDDQCEAAGRRQRVGRELQAKATLVMKDTWRTWPPATRKAFTLVALPYLSDLGAHKFDPKTLRREMSDVETELRELEKQGFVEANENVPGGWRVRPAAFLWPLADELRRVARKETLFEDWLKSQEIVGLLNRGQVQQLERSAQAAGVFLLDGAKTLIESAAKGAGESLFK